MKYKNIISKQNFVEVTKGVIRSRKTENDRQHKQKGQTITQTSKDQATYG